MDVTRDLKRMYLNATKKEQEAFRKWFNALQEVQFDLVVKPKSSWDELQRTETILTNHETV